MTTKQKDCKFEFEIYQISNPLNKMFRYTNDPKKRANRIADNLRARKGKIGKWADFDSWSQFDNVSLDDIKIVARKRIFESVIADIKDCN